MAELIVMTVASAFAAVGLSGTAFTVGATAVSWATIAAYVVVTALSLGVSMALASMQKKPKQSPQQQTLKQAMPPRYIVYGRDKVGGALAFLERYLNTLYIVQAHCQGPIDGIEQYWINDVNAGASIASGAPSPWTDHLKGESRNGWAGQSAFATLVAASYGAWTAAHRLDGVAATLIICKSAGSKFNSKVWPSGVPQLRVVMRGQADIYDPRSGVAAWTQNPSLIIRDYLTRRVQVTVGGVSSLIPVGFGISTTLIDEASFAIFANVCDEPVALASGATEPRYTVSTTIDLQTSEPRAVLAALLRACDGEIVPTADGKIAIRGGVWSAPTVSVGDDDILTYEYANGSGRAAAFNRLKITFKDRADYQPAECDPWEDLDDQAARGVLQQDFDVQSVPSFTQARRLARIFSARANPDHRLKLTVRYAAALRAWGERTVSLTVSELGLVARPCWIEGVSLDFDAMTGTIECLSADASAYDWSTALEGAPPATAASAATAVAPLPEATGLVVTIDRVQMSGGVLAARLVATLPETTAADAAAFEYRASGAAVWIAMTNSGDFSGRSEIVSDGGSYEVRAAYTRGVGYGGSVETGTWSATTTISIVANTTPPAASGSSLVAAGGSYMITVTWLTPSANDFSATRVYVGATTDFASAVERAISYAGPGVVASSTIPVATPSTYYVWVRAYNSSGVGATTPLGPVAVTTS